MKNILLSMLDPIEKAQLEEFYEYYPSNLIASYESMFNNEPMEASEKIDTDIESLIMHFLPVDNHNLRLFYQHNVFIKNQVKSVIYKFEGFGAAEDKARWVMETIELKLFSMSFIDDNQDSKHLKFENKWFQDMLKKASSLNENIEKEQQAKVSYQIPKLVFQNLDEIHDFFMAVCRFYYGYPEDYFKIFNDFEQRQLNSK